MNSLHGFVLFKSGARKEEARLGADVEVFVKILERFCVVAVHSELYHVQQVTVEQTTQDQVVGSLLVVVTCKTGIFQYHVVL